MATFLQTRRTTARNLGRLAVACGGATIWLAAVAVAAPASLESRLKPLIDDHEGQVAVAVRHLKSGESYSWRGDEPMPTASLIKVAVLIEAYRQADRGKLDLDQKVTVRKEDQAPGSGILTEHFSPGLQLSVRDALRLMIVWSDNTATNLVLDRIGLGATAAAMEELGCPNTKIHAQVFRGETSIFPDRSKRFGLGSTTANEMVSLFARLHSREIASDASCRAMLDHLSHCEDQTKLVRSLPPGTKAAHKTGDVTAVRTDAGILETPGGPVAVCVLTAENRDRRWEPDNAANLLCAAIGEAVYQHFTPPAVSPAADGDAKPLQLGSQGPLVEDLQRTLNARLSPSPELTVDGEFGPVTRRAVVRFQESQALPAEGVVEEATWKALGPLATEDGPTPAPEAVNSEKLTQQPPDALDGPPFVTCPAWAVADARTGEILGSEAASDARPIASTTKIMTAWLVVQLAEAKAEILEEEVTFSRRADETLGSSSELRAGERLSVGELLYGLLLPSGNDAAVALAEHFGFRFPPLENEGEAEAEATTVDGHDSLSRFIAGMNREAERLEMRETHYENPHGLQDSDHVSSARDLVKLARTAMQHELFRKYVQTRQHGCEVVGPGGYRRNVVWKNTNELLGIEGYLGVKTGTTTAAGACLVSQGRRGDDELLVVVLGAASSDARYTDTRNLYRWAWQKRSLKK